MDAIVRACTGKERAGEQGNRLLWLGLAVLFVGVILLDCGLIDERGRTWVREG